ncbi:flagellar hook-length control protein FliK [Paraburkholderia acidicola]|uniref:Flagellar hook-length control protein FliK n=1 Tax=Paraburkholderia acidicola TaxID=1912599 RepID=A0ABV1LLU1_9BURK
MNGIDTVIASLLASRIDSLLSGSAAGDATASQTGASALSVDTPLPQGAGSLAGNPAGATASTQTALSAVALTLDAIMRSGGEATPAVVGQVPVWPVAPATPVAVPVLTAGLADLAARAGPALPLFDIAAGPAADALLSSGSVGAGVAGSSLAPFSSTFASAPMSGVAASPLPVAALAAALQQTVAQSGLFYEAHLAQWLAGQRTPASLAGEPQNRLATASAQLPLEWIDENDPSAWSGPAQPSRAGVTEQPASQAAPQAPAAAASAHAQAGAQFAGAPVRFPSADPQTPGGSLQRSALHAAASGDTPTGAAADTAQPNAAAIHAATIPLVRQQLDLLATGQFRWTGEAWPGTRLDWTIEQENDERRRGASERSTTDDLPWRTRLTLSLPTLGTVDAELTLTGTQLIARVQASPGGAARLAAHGETFRQRLAMVGIELGGLSIREIGGAAALSETLQASGATASQTAREAPARMTPQAAATAYARSAAAVTDPVRPAYAAQPEMPLPHPDEFDWDA